MSAEAVQAARGQATERLVQRVVDLASHNLVAAASASGTTVLVATAGEEGTFDLQKPPNTPSAGMSATTHAAVVATAAAVATAIGALQQIHKPSDVGANALLTAALHKQSLVKLGRR